ncbi:MAG: ADP-ribosylglycohydrolase family protein [Armatimonadaceae bacterium]
MNTLPTDYEERVYAGVLGKIIGVYLGRPFEAWTNQRIERELGEVHYYVHEKLGVPLVVADDDISGTFTFLRALPDHLLSHGISAEQIGKTWLNYLIENRTVLWWGGMGVSTEHTAFLRLKNGVPAPQSGSIETNGTVVAEQIGAQIFIDGWAMVCPGDPEKAVALARSAGSVSHDGEAVIAAQVLAAMEAMAFVEGDIQTLIRTALTYIPKASLVHQMITDILAWHEEYPGDWRTTFHKIEEKWGYDTYGGGCHVLPNHAIIILSLLYGENDFQRSLMVANTAGWDTDCNSGNVGCLMGIKNGLEGINKSVDFRGPVADRLYLPTADGGRCVTDAVRETYEIVNIARALQGQKPITPEHGMRFHFQLPGSFQGFHLENSLEAQGTAILENVGAEGFDLSDVAADARFLAIRYAGIGPGREARVVTPTFLPPEMLNHSGGYHLTASPSLYSGQLVRARVLADNKNRRSCSLRLFIRVYSGENDRLEILAGPVHQLASGDAANLQWELPDTGGRPIAEVGLMVTGHSGSGSVYLDWMGWSGAPKVTFRKPDDGGTAWRRAWVNAMDEFRRWGIQKGMVYAAVQNQGTGLLLQGESSWQDYTISTVARPHLAEAFGIVAAARGLRRYLAVRLDRIESGGIARLILQHDDIETELDEMACDWDLYEDMPLSLTVGSDGRVVAQVGTGEACLSLSGTVSSEQARGSAGMLVRVGHVQYGPVSVERVEL